MHHEPRVIKTPRLACVVKQNEFNALGVASGPVPFLPKNKRNYSGTIFNSWAYFASCQPVSDSGQMLC